ncbi:nucleotidyltransferase domain-containing protein [Clostridium ihumii]|uniref:nucleotidyltransferase domain-containing protein n=1 Tax=Clostridium ihumii TaxID=1470356 RepID=UPI00058FE851|nr:nucleotidyltransferase domain-containing protein [Clostridium ihumii]
MNKTQYIYELKKLNTIISVCEFGSYRTKYWVENRSDIDLAIVLYPNVSFDDTLNIEDKIEELSKEYYKYDNIHLTFIIFNDFANKYARMAVDSDIKYIVNEEKWYDFQHYVLKFARNNREFEKTLKIDEQYFYFGGIIDESLL